jgi:RNA polymerase sigma-70 factor (ECF subfamily)
LFSFAQAYQRGSYDRDKGRLRTWLSGIVKKKVIDIHRKRRETPIGDAGRTTGFMEKIPDEGTMDEIWDAEWRRAVVTQCLEDIREDVDEKTVRAFVLFAWKGWSVEKVASELGVSRNAVYQAKKRVLSKIRARREYWEENW